MAYFAGLDVSVKEASVCIVDDAGKIVRLECAHGRAMAILLPGRAQATRHIIGDAETRPSPPPAVTRAITGCMCTGMPGVVCSAIAVHVNSGTPPFSPVTGSEDRKGHTREETWAAALLPERHSGRSTIETIHEVRLKQSCARFNPWVEQASQPAKAKTSRRNPPRQRLSSFPQ
jgi:hypothetical protein